MGLQVHLCWVCAESWMWRFLCCQTFPNYHQSDWRARHNHHSDPHGPEGNLSAKIFSSGTIKPRLVYHISSALIKNSGMDIRCNPVSDKMPVSDIVSRNIWIILLTLVDLPCYIIQPVLTLASFLACLWSLIFLNKIQTDLCNELCSVCLTVLSRHKTNGWKSHSLL